MATVNQSIDVDVPLSVAYNQWTQFETFPQFMKGVEAVEQIDETALHFSTKVGGVKRDFNAQIMEQVPDSLISWASVDGPRHSGTVRFEPLADARTRVSVEIEWEPETLTEKVGSLVGADELQVSADLDKFKEFIEGREFPTGAWRGAVSAGDVEDTGKPDSRITAEFPAVDPDLTAPAAGDASPADGTPAKDLEDELRKGQYPEGDYGAERIPDVAGDRPEGDYTAREAEAGDGIPQPGDRGAERGRDVGNGAHSTDT